MTLNVFLKIVLIYIYVIFQSIKTIIYNYYVYLMIIQVPDYLIGDLYVQDKISKFNKAIIIIN